MDQTFLQTPEIFHKCSTLTTWSLSLQDRVFRFHRCKSWEDSQLKSLRSRRSGTQDSESLGTAPVRQVAQAEIGFSSCRQTLAPLARWALQIVPRDDCRKSFRGSAKCLPRRWIHVPASIYGGFGSASHILRDNEPKS